MNKANYAVAVCASIMALCSISCGKSAQQQAEQAQRDSIDSVHRADSIYAAQTQEMLTTVSTALSPPFNPSLSATPSCAIVLPQSQKLKKRGQKKPVSLSFLKNL